MCEVRHDANSGDKKQLPSVLKLHPMSKFSVLPQKKPGSREPRLGE